MQDGPSSIINEKGVLQNPYEQSRDRLQQFIPDGDGNPIDKLWAQVMSAPKSKEVQAQYYQGKELDTSGRYKNILPGSDIEEIHAQGQGAWAKWGNAFTKMLGNTASTFLEGTVGLVEGLGEWAGTGDFSKIYDNKFNRALTDWTQSLENKYPNYYTHKETDADWYSPDNLLTANFWSDKVLKNLGFSLGAAAGGFAWGAALRGMRALTALTVAGADMGEIANSFEQTLSKVPQAEKASNAISYLSDRARQIGATINDLNKNDRLIMSAMGTVGEASMEAIQNSNQFRDNLIQEYKKNYGEEPDGKALQEINDQAKHVGNTSFLLNIPLLTATNYIMFPRLLNMTYGGEKALLNTAEGAIETQPLKYVGGRAVSALPQQGFGKLIYKAQNLAGLLFNPTEAFEEGAQNVIQEGTEDYYKKAYRHEGSSFWDSLGVGTYNTLNTKNGVEQILIGGISGALQTSGIIPFHRVPGVNRVFGGESQIKERGVFGYSGDREKATAAAISAINRSPFTGQLKDSVDSFNRAQVLQGEHDRAVRQGDILESKDKEFDFTHNYLAPRIKYGKIDFVKEDIDTYRKVASTPEGFQQLKLDGYASSTDTQESFLTRLQNMEEHANLVNKLYTSLNSKYSGLRDEKANAPYTSEVIDKMVYAASKIHDYDKRIPQLSQELIKSGVSVQEAIDNVYQNGRLSESATKDALNQINNLSTTAEDKDNLKRSLQDVLELSLRRGRYIKEYDKIRENPTAHQDAKYEMEQPITDALVLKQRKGEATLIVGQDYSLKNPVVRSGNSLIANPSISVISQTLRGEFEVKLPNGETAFLTRNQLESFQLSDLPRTGNEVNDILNKASEKVLAKKKFENIQKKEGQSPLDIVNTADNKELTDEVLGEANIEFKKLVAQKEKEAEELAERQKNKKFQEQIFKTQKERGTNTGNTVDVNKDIDKIREGDESRKKTASDMYSSTTSASEKNEPDAKVSPRVVRERNFLFNQTFFSPTVRSNLKALVFTKNQEASLKLNVIDSIYGEDPEKASYRPTDIDKGVVAVAYVMQRGGKYFYIDEKGTTLGEVGKFTDSSRIVFSILPTTSTTWRDGTSRFREQDQDKANQFSTAWLAQREAIFSNKETSLYDFTVSRGIPVYNEFIDEKGETAYRQNPVLGSLIPIKDRSVLSSQKVIITAQTDSIQHQGISYPTSIGFVYLQYNDRFAPLSNRQFSKEEQEVLFQILRQLSNETSLPDVYKNYIQNVLYFSRPQEGKEIGRNQIWIDDKSNLNFGNSGQKIPFTPTSIQANEASIKAFLAGVYNNTNNHTLDNKFAEPFNEITGIQNGKPVTRQWKNYQEFLLSDEYNGEKRQPYLLTPIRPLSKEVANDRNFQQKYAILQNFEAKPKIEEEQKAPPKETPKGEQVFTNSKGKKIHYSIDQDGFIRLDKTKGDYRELIDKLLALPETGQKAKEANVDPEEMAALNLSAFIVNQLSKGQETADIKLPKIEKKEGETTKPSTPPQIQGDEAEYRAASDFSVERMSELEKKEFREFIKKNLPQFEVKEVEDLLTRANNKLAWGKLQDAVITLYKAAEKGTGYHEAFEGVWKYFVKDEDQQAIYNEVRERKGSFKDRETNEDVSYINATDKQVKEKLADDFADYKTGKKKSLGQKVRDLFDRIIKFFRTFLRGYKTNPSLVDKLFKQIEKAEFKSYRLPQYLDKSQEFRAVKGLTESQTHGYVQDMTTRFVVELLKDGEDLFDLSTYERSDIFKAIKELYSRKDSSGNSVIDWFPEKEKTFDELKKRTQDYLKSFNIKFDEKSNVTVNDEGQTKIDYDSSSQKMTLDIRKTQPFAIKLLIGSLYKTKIDKNNNIVADKGQVGNFQLISSSRATITLLEALAGSTSVDDMIAKLKNLSNENSDYVRLVNRLGKRSENEAIDFENLTPVQWRMIAGFYDSFNKQKPEVRGIVVREDGETYFKPIDIGSTQRQVFDTWENRIRRNARDGKSIFLPYDRKTKQFKISKPKLDAYKAEGKTPEGVLKFLNDIGISIDKAVYDRMPSTDKDKIANSANRIFQYMTTKGGLRVIGARAMGISGPLSTLSEVYSKSVKPDAESTFINGDGEQQQVYVQPNYVSRFQDLFNTVLNLDDLKRVIPQLNDVYSRNSELLRPGGVFFDEKGDRTATQLTLGHLNSSERQDRGKVLKDIDYPERLETQVNSILDGIHYISVPADGSTEWYLNLPQFVGLPEVNNNEKINAKFRDYLADEQALAAENRNHISNIGTKAADLRFFKEIGQTDAEFQTYIDNEVKALKKTLLDNKTVRALTENRYRWPNLLDSYINKYDLSKEKFLSEEQLDNILRQVVVNDFVANMELHKVLFGDPYNFKVKADSLDEVKRIKSFLSPAQPSLVSDAYNNTFSKLWANTGTITDYIPRNNLTSSTLKDVEIASHYDLQGYDKVNEADSQAIHSILMHRDLLQRHWKWDENAQNWLDYELAYTRQALSKQGIDIGEYTDKQKEADKELLKEPRPEYKISVIKPIVRGVKAGEEIINTQLDKISSAPIWYSAVEGRNLEKLFVKMLQEKVDYVVTESGRKLGAEGFHNLYNQDGSFNDEPFNNKITTPWENYEIQVENEYDASGRQTRGTQITKLFSLDFFEEGKPVDFEGTQEQWEALTNEEKEKSEVEKRKNQNNRILNELTQKGYETLLNKLGIADRDTFFEVEDRAKLYNTLRDEAFRRDMPDNTRQVFELDETGVPTIPFEATSEYTKIQKMLYSMADKAILSPTHNGGQRVQVSALGWEKSGNGRGIVIKDEASGRYRKITRNQYIALSEEDKAKVKLTSSALKFYTKDDPYIEVLLPNWFREQLKKANSKMTDKEIIEYLNSEEGKEILKGIGFRIPTQGMNQIECFRVKGFLAPEYGDTIVVPSEITTKAGSDFDIDKLNTYLKNIYIDRQGKPRLIKFENINTNSEEELRNFYEDHVLDKYKKFRERERAVGSELSAERLLQSLGLELERSEGIDNLEQRYVPSVEEFILENRGKDIFELNKEFNRHDYKKVLENEYINNLEFFVTHPKNFDRLIQPTEGGPLRDIAKEIDKLTGQGVDTKLTSLISINSLSKLRQNFMSAKKWVGIVVNGITSHAQAQRTQLYLDVENTPLSQKDKAILGDGKINLPHNKTIVKGRELPTLSKSLDKAGKWISDKLSWYTTALVDVAKDPYITSIIHNKKLVPTFILLERLGVPTRTVAMFMNQPAIREYLKFSDRRGFSRLANTYWRDQFLGLNMFPAKASTPAELDVEEFPECIENFYSGKGLTEQQNAYQKLVLNEFLKYFKMAEHMFNFTVATNWDTANLKTSGSIFKKQLRTVRENKQNVWKTPARILNSTGIARIASTMVAVREAMSTLSRFESPLVRNELDEVLRPYASLEGFQDQADFEAIDAQITASFIDYLIGTKSGLSESIPSLLIDANNSVAQQVQKIQQDPALLERYNNNPIFQNLRVQVSDFENGGDNVFLKPFPKQVYDKDLVTGYLRELKELNTNENSLYSNLVQLALLQGVGKASNLTSYIPIEDMSEAISPLILGNIAQDAQEYKTNRNFERGNWTNESVVPTLARLEIRQDYNTGELIVNRNFPYKSGRILKLSDKYNQESIQYPVVKVRRTIPIFLATEGRRSVNRWDIVDQRIVYAKEINEKVAQNDYSFLDYVGYQRVHKPNGEPLTKELVDNKGQASYDYYYKQVNLMGTKDLAEHYKDDRASVLDNQTIKVENPSSDSDLQETILGPAPISSTLESTPTPAEVAPEKIISGGQTGADMAGLDAALELGIPTGGTAAAKFLQSIDSKTKKFNTELASKYGLKEGKTTSRLGKYGPYEDPYVQRTVSNAQEADGTIWFGNTDSAGAKLTLSKETQKGKVLPLINPKNSQEIKDWMHKNNIKVVNIAGNREWTNPGIHEKVKNILKEAFAKSGKSTTFVRHGETKEDQKGLNSGQNDIGITKEAEKKSEDIGKRLKEQGVTKIYTSPTERAMQTAQATGIPHEQVEGLKAWDLGDFTSKPESEFNEKHYVENPDEVVPNGESFNSFLQRTQNAINKITKEKTGNYAILTHSKTLKIIEALEKNKGIWNEEAVKDYLKESSPKNDQVEDFTYYISRPTEKETPNEQSISPEEGTEGVCE